MSWIQSWLVSILPQSWAESMEAESRSWFMQCSCGHEESVWGRGGIRWKAHGEPRRLCVCRACRKKTWHRTYFKLDTAEPQTVET